MAEYDVDARMSRFEWEVVQELRKLQNHGYGDLTLKCVGGIYVDMRVMQIPKSRQELEQLQT